MPQKATEEQRRLSEHFGTNVFTFIQADVSREIELAKMTSDCPACGTKAGGGNFLAALGLLCWTEYVGSFVTGRYGWGQARRNFDAFFKRLGPEYEAFQREHDVYDIFRCGMAHEYAVKGPSKVAMRRGWEECGVGVDRHDGRYYVVVERYRDDFFAAARVLHSELLAREDFRMPAQVTRPAKKGARQPGAHHVPIVTSSNRVTPSEEGVVSDGLHARASADPHGAVTPCR